MINSKQSVISNYFTLFGFRVTVFLPKNMVSLGAIYPLPESKLPPVSLFFSAAVLQLCGPIPLARQVPANLVKSFHSSKRIVAESSRSRPPRPGSPSAGRRAAWLPCMQPSAPFAGRPPSTPWQRRLL